MKQSSSRSVKIGKKNDKKKEKKDVAEKEKGRRKEKGIGRSEAGQDQEAVIVKDLEVVIGSVGGALVETEEVVKVGAEVEIGLYYLLFISQKF